MARQKISFGLSDVEIEKAIKELRDYQHEIKRKTEKLRNRIAEEIASSAKDGFGAALVNDLLNGGAHSASVEVSVEDRGGVTIVIASGADAIWAEFGAGVYYNGSPGQSPHPKGQELGLTIGSFGKGRGSRKVWGYYDENGGLALTHGTPASMPMYRAAQAVCSRISEIIREVFV